MAVREAASLKRSEYYIMAMRRWLPFLWKEPNGLLAGSCWFVLTCVPIITFGPASLALTHYMSARERSVKVTWRSACSFAFTRCGVNAWLMGFSDALALVMAGGCVLAALLDDALPMPVRFLYAVFLMTDFSYLLSGVYRYPALNAEPTLRFGMLVARGYLIAIGNLGWTLMFFCAQLLTLMICILTGVGIFILFPAASALLGVCAYTYMIRQYSASTDENEEEET